MPVCTGFKPEGDSRHDSIVWVSRLTRERYGMFEAERKSAAASLSFIAGPPTKLNPVSETIWLTRAVGRPPDCLPDGKPESWVAKKNFWQASRLSMSVEIAGITLSPSASIALIKLS